MTYNAIKGRFTRVAPDKSIVYGDKPYTFALTPEQSEQIDQAVYASAKSTNSRLINRSRTKISQILKALLPGL